MFRIGASGMNRKRQSVCDCIRLPPVPKHPGTAHPERLRDVSLPRASKSPDASGARCNRVLIVWWIPLRTPETKRPRVLEPEGVRVASGDRGDRSPRCERISRWRWSRSNAACREATARRAIRTRAGPHRACAMASVLRCGRTASWNSCAQEIAAVAKVAHLTRAVFVWQQNFCITDERRELRNERTKKEARIAAGLFCIRWNGRLT